MSKSKEQRVKYMYVTSNESDEKGAYWFKSYISNDRRFRNGVFDAEIIVTVRPLEVSEDMPTSLLTSLLEKTCRMAVSKLTTQIAERLKRGSINIQETEGWKKWLEDLERKEEENHDKH